LKSEDVPDALKHLLSYFARLTRRSDRRGIFGTVPINHATGLPESANDLVSRRDALSGPRLALECNVDLRGLAAATLRRETETSEGERELVLLRHIPSVDWTDLEAEHVDHFELDLAMAAASAAEEHGWFDLDPLSHLYNDYAGDNGKTCLKQGGLPKRVAIRWPGLKFAMEWVKRPENKAWDKDPDRSDGMSAEARRNAPEWAKAEGVV